VTTLALRDNPYVGLRPFLGSDSLYFFGRGRQTTELLELLHHHRFLGVVGSSGSGKSSLVRAGLVPSLRGGFLGGDRDQWRVVKIRPGQAPMANLVDGLFGAMDEAPTRADIDDLTKAVRERHADAVVQFLTSRSERDTHVLLLVDQFEEIFAFRGRDDADVEGGPADAAKRKERARCRAEAASFVDLILTLSESPDLPIFVVLTMRTEFLGDCDLFYGLPEALNRGRYLVPRLTREQLREAIEGPAALCGASIAPSLLDHVLNELGDRFDRLPVLQHALLRTWDAWKLAGGRRAIDFDHFDAAGGLERALDKDADNAMKGLDERVVAAVFKRLTDTDASLRRVRSPARISTLAAAAGTDPATIAKVVDCFHKDNRSFLFASADGDERDMKVDISHESLIRQWNRLRAWVDEERLSRDQFLTLVERARKHDANQGEPLWGRDLEEFVEWRRRAATAHVPLDKWATRYSDADDDCTIALRYLDASVDETCHELAEEELRRRWNKYWRPSILLAVGLAAALTLYLAAPSQTPAEPTAGTAAGVVPAEADVLESQGILPLAGLESGAKAATVIRSASRITDYLYMGLFVAFYFVLSGLGRRLHRGRSFDHILEGFRAAGGRTAIDTRRLANRLDALGAHRTTYASTGRRVVAYAIDWVCYFPFWAAAAAIGFSFDTAPPGEPASDGATVILVALSVVSAWLYETLPITGSRRATWGMRAVGIFRTDLHGEPLSFGRASAWYFARWLSYAMYGLGFLLKAITTRSQTLHDLLAGTVVLRRPKKTESPAVETADTAAPPRLSVA
jgi:uncharacterized RDD family membrane protein YckC